MFIYLWIEKAREKKREPVKIIIFLNTSQQNISDNFCMYNSLELDCMIGIFSPRPSEFCVFFFFSFVGFCSGMIDTTFRPFSRRQLESGKKRNKKTIFPPEFFASFQRQK